MTHPAPSTPPSELAGIVLGILVETAPAGAQLDARRRSEQGLVFDPTVHGRVAQRISVSDEAADHVDWSAERARLLEVARREFAIGVRELQVFDQPAGNTIATKSALN
jgi:hypothetical protein